MRIVTIAEGDPTSVLTWSGIPHFASAALEAVGHEIIPFRLPPLSVATRVADRAAMILRRTDSYDGFRQVERRNALRKFVKREKPDLVVNFSNKLEASALAVDGSTIYVGDATVPALTDYYACFTDHQEFSYRRFVRTEASAIRAAGHVLMSSDWAAASVVADLGIDPDKVSVAPFGACLAAPAKVEVLHPDNTTFVWCGVDWERKGGDLAVEAVALLRSRGYEAKLIIVGCEPPPHSQRDFVEAVGFLDKSNPEQLQKLTDIYKASLALLLPSTAEAFGMVFCEAASLARPSLAFRTGGVSSAVTDCVTGVLLEPGSQANDFADMAARMIEDKVWWRSLAFAARQRFEKTLNWASWSESLLAVAEQRTAQALG